MTLADLIARPDRWARMLGRASVAGVVCAIVGPFGSYPANLFYRLAFWIGLFWVGTLILWPGAMAALAVGERRAVPRRFAVSLATLVTCVPLSILAAAYGAMFWPVHVSAMGSLEWYTYTLFVALPAIAAMMRLERIGEGGGDAEAVPAAPVQSSSGGGALPDHLREAALCLQMEDHHVRVHTRGRSYLHLASMRAAVEDMAGRGQQVHRSWWVARDAVKAVEPDGRAVILVLVNGLRVPVARNRVAPLREQGWLEPGG